VQIFSKKMQGLRQNNCLN